LLDDTLTWKFKEREEIVVPKDAEVAEEETPEE
jgi:hypothetical protein